MKPRISFGFLECRVLKLCFLLMLASSAHPLFAEPLDWLYDVEVEVPTRSPAIAENAIQRALKICLMRVSGLDEIEESDVIRSALEEPSAYLLQYRFETVTDPTGNEKDVLEANFDKKLIMELTQRARLPIWPADRPSILMWMSIRSASSSSMLRTGNSEGVRIAQRARDRGVELVLPLMDLTDRQLLNASSIDGKFWLDVREASARYSAELTLAVSSHQNIFGDARLYVTVWFQDHRESWIIDKVESEAAGIVALDHAVDFLTDRFSIDRAIQHILSIEVSNIDTIHSYSELLRYLERQEFIDRLEVASYHDGVIELEIYTPSAAERFETLVDPDLLIGDDTQADVQTSADSLKFGWQGSR
ncbi:MAG: DUF2066 domain-containing protein [Gammaproteobacteria bacterium]|nr:DUF2066 domain-containing protein [Gammaproteobacteria bacterium]MYD79517.1 DUF2066 domain-containing protein [Gammaproteobacteria bacterium]